MSDPAAKVVLAMPIGLPPAAANAAAHYVDLATHISVQAAADRISVWAADDARWADLFAMAKGMLRYYPAGAPGPDGTTAAAPILALKTWLWDYLELRRSAGNSSALPTIVQYGGVDAAAVAAAIDAELAGNARYAKMSATERTDARTAFMTGSVRLVVAAGTRIGRPAIDPAPPSAALSGWRRLDLRFLGPNAAALNPQAAVDLWGAISGTLVIGHPFLALLRRAVEPAFIPLEGGTRIRIVGNGLVSGTTVDVAGTPAQDVHVDAAGDVVWATAPAGAAGAASVTVTVPAAPPVVHQDAVTYVTDVVSTARGVVASLAIVLAEVKDRATVLQTAGSLDDEAKATLKIALEFARRHASEIIDTRARNGGGSADDPLVEDAWSDALPTLSALTAVVEPLLALP